MRVLAMDIDVKGHHPSYIRNFAKTWAEYEIPGDLDFLVSRRFFELHPDATQYVQGLEKHGIRIHCLTEPEENRMESVPWLRHFRAWRLFCEYAKSFGCGHGLVMFSDYFQLPILLDRRSPCPFSMIYFRPTFHYQKLFNDNPPWKERFRAWRKKLLILRVLKVPKLERVYSLDRFAVEFMREHFKPQPSIEFLPEPVTIFPAEPDAIASLRHELGIEVGRKVFCLVGALDRRKGVRELLEAILMMNPSEAKRICVLLVGELHSSQEQEILDLLERIKRSSTAQVILRNNFVQEFEVQKYYELSDVTLTTYQNHMGGSSAVLRSALAKRPILSSNNGVMGETVRKRRLGLAIDTTKTEEIAKGIRAFLDDRPECMLDLQSARVFVEENSSARLAEAIQKMVILPHNELVQLQSAP